MALPAMKKALYLPDSILSLSPVTCLERMSVLPVTGITLHPGIPVLPTANTGPNLRCRVMSQPITTLLP